MRLILVNLLRLTLLGWMTMSILVSPSVGQSDVEPVVNKQPPSTQSTVSGEPTSAESDHGAATTDFVSLVFVFMLATFIGIGVIRRVSRLLHTPLMSLTNAISAISVVGAIIVAGGEHYPTGIRVMGSIALFTSMTNIISGFLITDRMLKMFKTRKEVAK